MKVRKVAFGDSHEAYVEDRFTDGVNVVFSNDNNKGKTILFQGLMFSLGYGSIFPSSFNQKNKYFYSCIENDEREIEFLRKNNTIVVKMESGLRVFNSINDFKYFFDENIFPLPKIYKDGRFRTIDLNLLYEVFFIGQDHRTPSNLIVKGAFNKVDFKNMVFAMAGISDLDNNDQDHKDLKEEISYLKMDLKSIKKKIKVIKENYQVAEYVSKAHDEEYVKNSIEKINPLYATISELRKNREREINRRIKLEHLISELNSLNRELSEGEVKCGDCGSSKIIYSNGDISFNVSDINIRADILNSIRKQIDQKQEAIEDLSVAINDFQGRLSVEIGNSEPSLVNVLVWRECIVEGIDYDNKAHAINAEINILNEKLGLMEVTSKTLSFERDELNFQILKAMNFLINKIDPNSTIVFDDLFTKRDMTFSGSEEQEFYFCKVYALNQVLKHKFPIIIDSFRDGEISTEKEKIILNLFKKLNKQIILSATLKDEEYEANKYHEDGMINSLDYSYHRDSKILSTKYSEEFKKIIDSFGVDV
ncbi:hypothetical protein HS962_06935 [Pantoea sp. BIGb0393]|uniref:Rad50/SbcC-type AAA domain-containing protein n=1 Tax=Pantoea nemavictus TaxID=2726955 RepID=A0ABU8PQD3_9GAMM|nr:hypothetical protein [Pantoea nemavictus]MBA0035963.1 hypothetical protein [Pantoea nemavictus]